LRSCWTPENVASGPVYVRQRITRVDEPVPLTGFLASLQERLIREGGYSLVPGAPNDGGTFGLVKREGEIADFHVGFIKNEMVILTQWLGLASVVSLQGILTLAGTSSTRYDLAVGPTGPASAPAPSLTGSTQTAPAARPQALDPSLATRCFKTSTELALELNRDLRPGSDAGGRFLEAADKFCREAALEHGVKGVDCFEWAFSRALKLNADLPRGSDAGARAALAFYRGCVGE
jgi:hypothetical protein